MLDIKIFSDFACPFCFIVTGIFDKLKEDGVEFAIEWIPYEMHPDIPLEGKSVEGKHPKGYAEKMYEMLNKLGTEYGIKYKMQEKDYNTHRALLAGEYAKSVGKYDEFSKKIFKAYFTDLKNIGNKDILDDIAKKAGLNIEEMNNLINAGKYEANLKRAKNLIGKFEVEGTPTFIINDQHKMVGVRPYEQMKRSFLAYS
ncbi:putative DSBA oxidoreductase [[Clostridium] ultunense Esp]|uniref:Putative DSBA oxidoreductase n=1 Tax=[Clostridium] ultunense Esp TaxID=1288971 RepID=M1Z8M8_9FIRM|nr:DsbA family protein [Schnuerera ultunensis]CCQ93928.1 putative DSBA oxidoreductase [[Clostridium] ultunense Esp]SHD77337.1 putative DSBA oxidoreductase [[Clostridium] ultunense Esp]